MSANNKNPARPNHFKDLLLLFSVPVTIAIIVAAVIYIPQMLANPKYSFIYYVCDVYCRDDGDYTIDASGEIQLSHVTNNYYNNITSSRTPSLRIYDVETNSSSPISLNEAQNYKLNPSSKSPDGYTLEHSQSSSGFFLFWGDSSSGWRLKSGMQSKNITLSSSGRDTYYGSIRFLGWVSQ